MYSQQYLTSRNKKQTTFDKFSSPFRACSIQLSCFILQYAVGFLVFPLDKRISMVYTTNNHELRFYLYNKALLQ